jgi:hypothetical protein
MKNKLLFNTSNLNIFEVFSYVFILFIENRNYYVNGEL